MFFLVSSIILTSRGGESNLNWLFLLFLELGWPPFPLFGGLVIQAYSLRSEDLDLEYLRLCLSRSLSRSLESLLRQEYLLLCFLWSCLSLSLLLYSFLSFLSLCLSLCSLCFLLFLLSSRRLSFSFFLWRRSLLDDELRLRELVLLDDDRRPMLLC